MKMGFATQEMTSESLKKLFQTFPDLAADTNGGKVLFATDDFFAPAENMISRTEPVWDEAKYTQFGKWMDGWETRRKRTLGHDWCILKLGLEGRIVGIDADTAFFTGNNVPAISIQAALLSDNLLLKRRKDSIGTAATAEETEAVAKLYSEQWTEILPLTPLKSGYPETRHNLIVVNSEQRWSHLRVNIYPDGGLSRLRVYGDVIPDWQAIRKTDVIDLASLKYGGKALEWSNAHYGQPMQLLAVERSLGMFDGWETSRNPQRPYFYTLGDDGNLIIPGNEWAIIKLGHRGSIRQIIVDTNHYKGNYPESCFIEGKDGDDGSWTTILPRVKLSAHQEHLFPTDKILSNASVTHVRLTMYPDGGISRLRIFGTTS